VGTQGKVFDISEQDRGMNRANKLIEGIGAIIFAIRWLLVPMYLLLYIALGIYLWNFCSVVIEMVIAAFHGEANNFFMLAIIELVDMTMIANLVVMTTTGGYSIFVKEYPDDMPNRPRWLSKNFSSSEQKIKMVMSLIAIADITLLNELINTKSLTAQVTIIAVFIVSGFAFCLFNLLMHHKSLQHDTGEKHEHA
jgi:uncharacterized protein (TIGR00645 family)